MDDDIAQICRVAELSDDLCLILLVGEADAELVVLQAIADHIKLPVHWHDLASDGVDLRRWLPAEGRSALLVHGLALLEPTARRERMRGLNLTRDALRHENAAIVIWVARDDIETFVKLCADLFAWRALLVAFDEASLNRLRSHPVAELRALALTGLQRPLSADERARVGVLRRSFRQGRQRWARDVLGGRYALLEPIDINELTIRCRANDLMTGATVMVEVIDPERAANPEFRRCFQQNQEAMARQAHPGVVRVLVPFAEDGVYFAVLEWAGRGLDDGIRWDQVDDEDIHHLIGVASAILGALHAQGISHSAIRPNNLLLQADGGVKWTDLQPHPLQVAIGYDPDHPLLGWQGWFYIAPEQLLAPRFFHQPVCDVYSLGMIALFALRRGRIPHPSLRPGLPVAALDVPAQWKAVLTRALAYRPEDRFPDAAAFHAAWMAAGPAR